MNDVLDDYALLYKLAFAEVAPVMEQVKQAGLIGDVVGGIGKRVGRATQRAGQGVENAGEWFARDRGPSLSDAYHNLQADAPAFRARADAAAARPRGPVVARGVSADPSPTDVTNVMRAPQAPASAPSQPKPRGEVTQAATPSAKAQPGAADGTRAETPSAKGTAPTQAQAAAPTDPATQEAIEGAAEAGVVPRRNPLITAGLLAGAGGGGYLYGQHEAEQEGIRNRNLAFGAGLATGTVAPQLVRRAGSMLSSIGGSGGYGPGGY